MGNTADDVELGSFRIPRGNWEATPESAQAPVMVSLDGNIKLRRQVLHLSERLGKQQRSKRPSHPGQSLALYLIESSAEVFDHIPNHCRRCGHDLTDRDPAPYRHQIVEFLPIVPTVAEHRLHQRKCAHCGTLTRHPLKPAVTRSD